MASQSGGRRGRAACETEAQSGQESALNRSEVRRGHRSALRDAEGLL